MSTAIVRIYTKEGFVIAGDGLRTYENGQVVSINVKKIFPTQSPKWGSLAFALMGWTHVEQDGFEMDWIKQANIIAEELQSTRHLNIDKFAARFAERIRRWVRQERIHISGYNDMNDRETKVLLVGYFKGTPAICTYRLQYKKDSIQISCWDKSEGHPRNVFSGSSVIYRELCHGTDPHFEGYRSNALQKLLRGETISLNEGIEVAKNYIAACSDPKAREMDEDCLKIGGHIHIATITPETGFSWHTPPL